MMYHGKKLELIMGGYEHCAQELIPDHKYLCTWFDKPREVTFLGIDHLYEDGAATVNILAPDGVIYIGSSAQLYDAEHPHIGKWMEVEA